MSATQHSIRLPVSCAPVIRTSSTRRIAGRSPFSFAALDLKTMAMMMLGKPYRHCSKKDLPRRWFDDLPHRHVALDDAVEQGALFCNMLAEWRQTA